MKQLSDEEIKLYELDILRNFSNFCRGNSLKYSIAEGTLIGAVRHKGFIPWDDDIDIIMDRDDFEKFRKKYTDNRYKVLQPSEGSMFPCFYIRLTDSKTLVDFPKTDDYHSGGIWIDILPIDNFPDDDKILKLREFLLLVLFRIYRAKTKRIWSNKISLKNNLLWLCLRLASFPVPKNKIRCYIESLMRAENGKKTMRRGTWTMYWHHPWLYPSHVFNKYSEIEFEGENFSVISEYDAYLRCQYGDYMTLPPENKRIGKHDYVAYFVS